GGAGEPRDQGGNGRRIGHARPPFAPPPTFSAADLDPHPPMYTLVNNLIRCLSTASPGSRAWFRAFVARPVQGSAAFCTGLSPTPRPRGAAGKALDSSLKYKRPKDDRPLITSSSTVL